MIRTLLLFLLCFSLCGVSVANGLRIYFVDVEQGAATLLVSPSNKSLLIDSGKDGMGGRIKAAMDDAGIKQIDYYVTTHYDAEHYGGIEDLVAMPVVIGNPIDRGGRFYIPEAKKRSESYVSYAAAVGNRAIPISRGRTIPLDDKMLVSIVSASGVVLGERNPVHATSENDMSISLLIQYGDFQLFVGGDISEKIEAKIAERNLVQEVDIYHANNHGSPTSSSLAFLQNLNPSLIVISNGSDREYQHPSKKTLRTFAELTRTPMVLQTNKYVSGGSSFGNVSDALIADLPPNDKLGTIKVQVGLDTTSFTVGYRNQLQGFSINEAANRNANLVIESILPDPDGKAVLNENVTLRNRGDQSVSLNGMRLIDNSKRIWMLFGEIDAGGSMTVTRGGMPMSLDDSGDMIRLLAPNLKVLDRFEYSSSQKGQVIQTGH